jgi:hypothetical protein
MADETPTNEQGMPLEALEIPMTRAEFDLAIAAAKSEIILKEVEVSRLNLLQNDVLVVKMQGNDFGQELIESLQNHFRKVFPQNKVLVFSLTDDLSMDLEIVRAALLTESEASSCSTAPKGYCEGCDCGKKEAAESLPIAKPTVYRIPSGTLVKVIEAGSPVEGETGSIESYIGGGFYLVRFTSVGVIKVDGLGLEEQKGA